MAPESSVTLELQAEFQAVKFNEAAEAALQQTGPSHKIMMLIAFAILASFARIIQRYASRNSGAAWKSFASPKKVDAEPCDIEANMESISKSPKNSEVAKDIVISRSSTGSTISNS